MCAVARESVGRKGHRRKGVGGRAGAPSARKTRGARRRVVPERPGERVRTRYGARGVRAKRTRGPAVGGSRTARGVRAKRTRSPAAGGLQNGPGRPCEKDAGPGGGGDGTAHDGTPVSGARRSVSLRASGLVVARPVESR